MWWRSIYRYPQDLPYYAVIDFGSPIPIDCFAFQIPSSSNRRYANNKRGHIEISDDKQNWTYLCDWNLPAAATQTCQVEFERVNTRYLKFVIEEVFRDATSGFIKNPNATAVGELSASCLIGGESANTEPKENSSSLVLSNINNYSIEQFEAEYSDAGYTTYQCKLINHGDDLYDIGYELDNNDASKIASSHIFIIKSSKDNLSNRKKLCFDMTEGDISYYDVTSATVTPDGYVLFVARGHYNSDSEAGSLNQYKKGDVAGVSRMFMLVDDALVPVEDMDNAIEVASAGVYLAVSQKGETGNVFSLNKIAMTGIDDIIVDESNETVYYNLQGIRVVSPGKGLYIVRKGNQVTKEFIRHQ